MCALSVNKMTEYIQETVHGGWQVLVLSQDPLTQDCFWYGALGETPPDSSERSEFFIRIIRIFSVFFCIMLPTSSVDFNHNNLIIHISVRVWHHQLSVHLCFDGSTSQSQSFLYWGAGVTKITYGCSDHVLISILLFLNYPTFSAHFRMSVWLF